MHGCVRAWPAVSLHSLVLLLGGHSPPGSPRGTRSPLLAARRQPWRSGAMPATTTQRRQAASRAQRAQTAAARVCCTQSPAWPCARGCRAPVAQAPHTPFRAAGAPRPPGTRPCAGPPRPPRPARHDRHGSSSSAAAARDSVSAGCRSSLPRCSCRARARSHLLAALERLARLLEGRHALRQHAHSHGVGLDGGHLHARSTQQQHRRAWAQLRAAARGTLRLLCWCGPPVPSPHSCGSAAAGTGPYRPPRPARAGRAGSKGGGVARAPPAVDAAAATLAAGRCGLRGPAGAG